MTKKTDKDDIVVCRVGYLAKMRKRFITSICLPILWLYSAVEHEHFFCDCKENESIKQHERDESHRETTLESNVGVLFGANACDLAGIMPSLGRHQLHPPRESWGRNNATSLLEKASRYIKGH